MASAGGELVYRRCAGAVLLSVAHAAKAAEARVVIAQRTPQEGKYGGQPAWQFPQGGADEGESIVDAARREAHEELGIPAEALKLVREFDEEWKYPAPEGSWLLENGFAGQAIRFVCFEWDGSLEDETGMAAPLTVSHDEGSPPEFCAVKWMALGDWDAELTPYVADFKRPFYDALRLLVEPVADELLTE